MSNLIPPPYLVDAPAEPETPRRLWAWWTVAALFAFLIITAVATTFEEDRGDFIETASNQNTLEMSMSPLMRTASKSSGSSSLAKSVQKIVDKSGPDTARSSEIAIQVAVARRELKQASPAGELKSLQRVWLPTSQAASVLYASNLEEKVAKAVLKTIPEGDEQYNLVRVQAGEVAGDTTLRASHLGQRSTAKIVLIVAILGGLAAGIAIWICYFVYRDSPALRPKGFPSLTPTRGDADVLMIRGLIMMLAYLTADFMPRTIMPLRIGVFFAVIVAGLLIPIGGKRLDLKSFFGKFEGKHILWGVGAVIANAPLIFVTTMIATALSKFLPAPVHPAAEEMVRNPSFVKVLSFFLLASIQAPLVEESIFRGLFANAIARLRGPVAAVIISSFMFASIHPQGIAGWLPLACIGGMSAVLAYHTKSLWPSIIMHFVHNSAILAVTLLSR